MSTPDPALLAAIKAFLVPTFFGGICYLMATLGARYISPVPKHVYIGRIVLMFVLGLPLFFYFIAHGDLVIINGQGPPPRKIGTFYGAHTIIAWFALALISRPATKEHERPKA
jgi:hypothetical protein